MEKENQGEGGEEEERQSYVAAHSDSGDRTYRRSESVGSSATSAQNAFLVTPATIATVQDTAPHSTITVVRASRPRRSFVDRFFGVAAADSFLDETIFSPPPTVQASEFFTLPPISPHHLDDGCPLRPVSLLLGGRRVRPAAPGAVRRHARARSLRTPLGQRPPPAQPRRGDD